MAASPTTPSASTPGARTAPGRRVGDLLARFAVPLAWGLLPFAAGAALADALDPRSRPVQLVASCGLWLFWAVGLGAALVPRSTSLTVLRIIVPASILATGWAALAAPTVGAAAIAGITVACVATVLAFAPFTGDVFVNGSAYGDERRMPLRPPGALLLGPIELAWLACVVGTCAGPLLLAAQAWIAGGLALLLGWPATYVAARALHGLAQRWVVFVPAGFVLHDQMAIADPLLLPRRMVARLGPAPADTIAHDLTLGSLGLALEVVLTESTPIAPTPRRSAPGQRPTLETVEVDRLLFAPTRPGAVLREAAARRLPVA